MKLWQELEHSVYAFGLEHVQQASRKTRLAKATQRERISAFSARAFAVFVFYRLQ